MANIQLSTALAANNFASAGIEHIYSGDPSAPLDGDFYIDLTDGLKIYKRVSSAWVFQTAAASMEGVYAYLSTATDTVITTSGSWYRFEGVFTNTIASSFTADANGITYTGEDKAFEVEFVASGQSDKTARICIALALDATFDTNGLLTTGTIIPGSTGSTQADIIGASDGFVQISSIWAGTIENGQKISLIIQSDTGATTFTPTNAAASLHKFF